MPPKQILYCLPLLLRSRKSPLYFSLWINTVQRIMLKLKLNLPNLGKYAFIFSYLTKSEHHFHICLLNIRLKI